jgi:hypothetical protein
MQTLHRSRDRLVGERTALINQLRAILLERGMVAPQGKRKLEQFLAVLIDEQGGAGLSPRMIVLVADARTQWAELDRRIGAFDGEFVRWVKENEEARRLMTIPGVGAIVASALVAAVGQAESFERGRDLAAWLGLVPRQFTTGRQAEAARYQQARQQIPAPTADPWSARGAALCGRARHAARPMGERSLKSRPPQRCDRRLRQQAGEDRLGGAAARRTVRRHRNAGGGIELGRSRSKRPTVNRGLREVTTGWPDSRTTLWKPGSKNGAI